jgi:hypothetical protein
MSCINKIKNVEQKHEAHRAAWKQTKVGKKTMLKAWEMQLNANLDHL